MLKVVYKQRKKILMLITIFILSYVLRLWNLNQMGRTWDEAAYVEVGNKFVSLLEKGDFLNKYFYDWVDEPPLARYIYGIASMTDKEKVGEQYLFNYDYTYAHLTSAFFSSLSVSIIVMFGFEFISTEVGVYSGIILSMLPLFMGYSQISTLETILFFTFTSSVFCFFRFIRKPTYRNSVILGLMIGIAVLSKFTNILIIPLLLLIFIVRKMQIGKYIEDKFKKGLVVLISSIFIFFIVWPMAFFNPIKVLNYSIKLRTALGKYPSIEIFFGKLIHVPIFYYFVFFLITTPLLILILFFIGSKYISDFGKNTLNKEKKWIYYSLIIWFCFPFLQSFYNFRQQGIRFIIEIYAPLSLISAIGFDYISRKLTKKIINKFLMLLILILYLFIILVRITPYYLDYYNVVVGGTKSVYEKGLFEIGWWGQGLREAGYYLRDHAAKNSSIGLAVSPVEVFPNLPGLKTSTYQNKKIYDYVVVNYFHVLREGFDDSFIRNHYKLIYTVKADGGILVSVYKKI